MIETIDQWQSVFVEDGMFACAKAVENCVAELTPVELEAIASSVAIRQHTYSTGRYCAKKALLDIGFDQHHYIDGLLRKEDGSVAWPQGAIGSISHTNDWAIAAVAKSGGNYLSLGIDIERIDRVSKDVLRLIATDEERVSLELKYKTPWGRVALFSIKESLYKCLRPLYGEFIQFKDVQITNLTSPLTASAQPVQTENSIEIYSPTVQLLLPSLAERYDEHRIHVRLAILPSHVLSLVSYHAQA